MNNQKIITKSVNEEKRLATFVVLEPQAESDVLETTDLHLQWYDEDMVEKACHNFNRFCRKANILHMIDTNAFEFIESYITKAEMKIADQVIKAGTWLATIYVKENSTGDWIWEGIKDGTFDGLSIQALGTVEDIKD